MTADGGRPIRVANIIARLNIGGPAIHVALITEQLNPPAHPEYHSQLIVGQVGPGEGDMTYYAREHGVEPVVIPALGRELHPLRDLQTLWTLVRLLRRERPDVVNTHTAKAGFIGRVAARLAGVPVVVHTFHGHVFHGYFSPAKTRFFQRLEQLTAPLADTIIALTPSQRDELAHTYHIAPAERFTVMPLGLDLRAAAAVARKSGSFRAAWSIPADAPLVSIVGRMVPVKDHALFLQAAARVHAARPDARFALVGDGELRAAVEAEAAALGLMEACRFTGWQKDVLPAYADSDVLVISSRNEGTPLTVIEALACGCPVAATAVGGLPDVLADGRLGRLARPGDPDALAAAILATLEAPPDPAALRAAALEAYSIDRLTRDLDALYRRLLAQRGRR